MQSLLLTLVLLATSAAAAEAKRPATPVHYSKPPPPDGMTYTVTCHAGKSPGGPVFLNHIGAAEAKQAMSSATQFVWNMFNQTHPGDRRNGKNEIHVNANFLGKYKGNIRREFVGIVYHQVTRVWQWTGGKDREAPKGLLTGIAEFVRMEAHYGTSEKVKPGEGKQWDQGFGVTARFLAHCEKAKKGFVKELNKRMRYGYTKAYFYDILGKPVDQLWKEYKSKYPKY
ncbi:unnamed protein product [Linum tenue]|uniref:Uncharacterized protein n=1 Tax=Linum tenue TaxID=586396 RepID=A0AAV0PBQ8_9ROSI|nr:unnamed protein product [Linum tenue]